MTQADRLITCYKTYTNAATHQIVKGNAHRLPAYESGGGKGAGPRYCPSLYSKVERFPNREGDPPPQPLLPLPPPPYPPAPTPPTPKDT